MGEPSSFGERLRHLRERKKWTQHKLAKESGVPRPSITRAESGVRKGLSVKNTAKLAAALGVTIDRLVGDVFEKEK